MYSQIRVKSNVVDSCDTPLISFITGSEDLQQEKQVSNVAENLGVKFTEVLLHI